MTDRPLILKTTGEHRRQYREALIQTMHEDQLHNTNEANQQILKFQLAVLDDLQKLIDCCANWGICFGGFEPQKGKEMKPMA